MKTLTPTQIELLKNNKENLEDIFNAFNKYLSERSIAALFTLDDFILQFTVEPEWTIESYKDMLHRIWTRGDKNYWRLGVEYCADKLWTIHSVQYKSETLTVSDWCDFLGVKNKQIVKFEVVDSVMRVYYDDTHFNSIELVKKIERKPIMTTTDGVDIFSEETETWRTRDGKVFKCQTASPYRDSLMWSTKEKATEYVLLNSPKLSVNDVMAVVGLYVVNSSFYKDELVELVKNKQ